MIKKIYIGTSLNIFIGIIFFLIYFYSNYFVMNDHFYKIKYHEDYKVYNKKFKDEFNTIIDFYFKLIQESDLDVVLIDFNNELLFIVDPIINNNYERAEYLAFKNDVRKIEFKTKRAHKFIHLNNQLYITIQSSKKEIADENIDLILESINPIYEASIFENSYNKISLTSKNKILEIEKNINFLINNNQNIFEYININGMRLFKKFTLNSLIKQSEDQLTLEKSSLIKITSIINEFKSIHEDKNLIFLTKEYDFTNIKREFPITIIFLFFSLQLLTFIYSFSSKYYFK